MIASGLLDAGKPISRRDFFWLAIFCLALFGYAMFGGRPLTLHEARLPECAREMLSTHDWLIPRSGGRPWLERPPLPHWITIATSLVLGQRCDSVWVVRLPSAIMGTIITLLTAWMAGRFFGRWIGLASGFLLATSYEFHQYATLAEDDIYLAALVMAAMACFAKAEFAREQRTGETWWGGRSWEVVGFFLFTGLTNLVKGPLVGAAIIGVVVGPFLLLRGWQDRDWRPLRRYLWPAGMVLFVALTLFWPMAVVWQFPAVLKNWSIDYADTNQYDEAWWYYFPTLLGELAPWTPLALIGVWQFTQRKTRLTSAENFVLLWAIMPLILLSIPHRKHHHYLLPCLPAWGTLCGIGTAYIVPKIFQRGEPWREATRIGLASVILLGIGYCAGTTLYAGKSDRTLDDTAFLRRVSHVVSPDQPLLINASSRSSSNGIELDFFRIQFYLRADATLLHNLTFLRQPEFHGRTVYVITRANDQSKLETLGWVQEITQSTKTRGESLPSDRFTLFRLSLRPDLPVYSCTQPIDTLQAMGRAKGPWCGPPLEENTGATQPTTQRQ